MMAAVVRDDSLIGRLPAVRGRLRACVGLAGLTWFGVGGAAEVVFRPSDRDDLAAFLAAKPAGAAVTVLGVGSNLLVRDGGIAGVVVRLGGPFAGIDVGAEGVRAGAGALDGNVARTAAAHGIGGLEFLSGIPGTIGGALRMNAGAYGAEMRDVVLRAEAVGPEGTVHDLGPGELGFGYRSSAVPEDWIFTGALLRAEQGDAAGIVARMAEIRGARDSTQPVRARTGGSTFKNPDRGNGHVIQAWELIRQADCQQLRRGGARVSDQHSNFLVNTGGATAADLESLGEEIVRRVREATGVSLEWEIRRVGAVAGNGPCGGGA